MERTTDVSTLFYVLNHHSNFNFASMEDIYKGLSLKELQCCLQYVFIYEQKIKPMKRVNAFKSLFVSAFDCYEKKLQKQIQFRSVDAIQKNEISFNTGTCMLYISSSNKAKLLHFCNKLRNSICHALIQKEGNNFLIKDFYKHKCTCSGSIHISDINEFIELIIKNVKCA